jgi:hypothetical protein
MLWPVTGGGCVAPCIKALGHDLVNVSLYSECAVPACSITPFMSKFMFCACVHVHVHVLLCAGDWANQVIHPSADITKVSSRELLALRLYPVGLCALSAQQPLIRVLVAFAVADESVHGCNCNMCSTLHLLLQLLV